MTDLFYALLKASFHGSIVILAVLLLSKPIGAYALGEGYAQSMGIRVKPFRILLILLSSVGQYRALRTSLKIKE